MSQTKYIFSTVTAGILWGCISLFLKNLYGAGFSQLQVMFLRSFLATLFLGLFLLFKDRSLFKIDVRDLWIFIGSGVVSLTFFTLCYFRSILFLGASVAVILLYTSPIFVLILSFFLFREKITGIKLIALIMTFAGCLLVTGLGSCSSISIKGFLIGLCSGLGYALYSVFGRYAMKKYKQPVLLFYTFLFSTIAMLPFARIGGIPELLNLKTSLLSCGIALFCTVFPYAFYTFGLSGLENGKAAIFVTVEPLVGSLVGILVFREDVSIPKIAGISVMLTAIVLLGKSNGSKKSTDIPAEGSIRSDIN